MNKFWKDAVPYDGPVPAYRFHDEWYHIVSDSGFVIIDEYFLKDAVDLFHKVTDGETCAVYLYRGRDHLVTYNGVQSAPQYETTYHVTKDALPEWLAVLAAVR